MRYTRIELDSPTEMNIMHAFRTEQVVLLPPGTAGCPHGQVVGPSPDRPGELTVMTGSGDPIMIDVSPEQLEVYAPQARGNTRRCSMV